MKQGTRLLKKIMVVPALEILEEELIVTLKVVQVSFDNFLLYIYLIQLHNDYLLHTVNCQWSSWSSSSSCTKSCGGGTLRETRHKTVKENHGGTCSGAIERRTDCNTQSCPSIFLRPIYYI